MVQVHAIRAGLRHRGNTHFRFYRNLFKTQTFTILNPKKMETLNRTGHEYYSKMPKDIRQRWSKARKHYERFLHPESKFLDKTFYDHRDFILESFRWSSTEEGLLFWECISNSNYKQASVSVKPKTSIRGTITFIALILLLLGFYVLIWLAFFHKESPIRKATGQKFISVTVWEKPDTMDMVYANKNYKANE